MHELAIAQSLIGIIKEEMKKHEITTLDKAYIKYGKLTAIVPGALELAYQACTQNTDLENTKLVLIQVPVQLRCSHCQLEFSPDETDMLFIPCPKCTEGIGHEVIAGKELFLEKLTT